MLLEKARQSIEDERKLFDQSTRKLEERLRELTLTKEESLMKVKTIQDMNTELRITIDKLRTQVILNLFYSLLFPSIIYVCNNSL